VSLPFDSNIIAFQPTYGIYHDNWISQLNGISFGLGEFSSSLELDFYLPSSSDGYNIKGESSVLINLYIQSELRISESLKIQEGMNTCCIGVSPLFDEIAQSAGRLFLIIKPSYELILPGNDSRKIFIILAKATLA
jgi:hypothetical protein